MTLIVKAKNKAELKQKLDAGCVIQNPTPWGQDDLLSNKESVGFRGAVCLDPETRRRFAQIEKTASGWKVK